MYHPVDPASVDGGRPHRLESEIRSDVEVARRGGVVFPRNRERVVAGGDLDGVGPGSGVGGDESFTKRAVGIAVAVVRVGGLGDREGSGTSRGNGDRQQGQETKRNRGPELEPPKVLESGHVPPFAGAATGQKVFPALIIRLRQPTINSPVSVVPLARPILEPARTLDLGALVSGSWRKRKGPPCRRAFR